MAEGKPPDPPRAGNPRLVAWLAFLAIALTGALAWQWGSGEWRPQVDVKNEGAAALRVVIGTEELTVGPGTTGSFRCGEIESFLVHDQGDPAAPPWTVHLGAERMAGKLLGIDEKRGRRRVAFSVEMRQAR